MTKIITTQDPDIKSTLFSTVRIGDVFMYQTELYVRTGNTAEDNNVYNLSRMGVTTLRQCSVKPVKTLELHYVLE